MPATVTLATATLQAEVNVSDGQIVVDSTSGLTASNTNSVFLFCEGELMEVVSLGVNPVVNVLRGVQGTGARYHEPGATIYVGRGDQFYSEDPVGSPKEVIPVSPWINVVNGSIWFAQGDAIPGQYRWWQQQATVYDVGPVGVRTFTLAPTAST